MGKILCATRGGDESRETLQAAISLAKESGEPLVFLYIADASFLDRTAAPVVVDVEEELERMGRFHLAMAREQAAAQGVDAQVIVRHGHVLAELVAAAQEVGATLIILGRPREATAFFDDTSLLMLAVLLQNTGAEVRIL